MITVYTKPGCGYCDLAKAWLTDNGFEFESIDVTKYPDAMSLIVQDGHRTVPQIYQNGKVLVSGGYSGLNKLSAHHLRALLI